MRYIEWHARVQQLGRAASEEACEAMITVLREQGMITPQDIPVLD
jgi:hypothetical protein